MQSIQVARKIREHIHGFMGIIYPHFSKPKAEFIGQMIYGIEASQDVKLSEIARSLGEDILLKKTSERLSRNLKEPGLGERINELIAGDGAGRVNEDTLIVVDTTDVHKTYARRMPYLDRVRDGNTGEIVNGYWGCLALACEVGKRRVIPLQQRLWSAQAPDFISENQQLCQVLESLSQATKGRGIYVMDRGADRSKLFNYFLDNDLRFIVRLVGCRRDLLCRGERRCAEDIGRGCQMLYRETVVKEEQGQEKKYHLEYGFRKVKLPGRGEDLFLVVVKGFGREPWLLLTNLSLRRGRRNLWFVVRGYLSRWLVEDTIRFIKQTYQLEDLRVLNYERMKNLVALVLAAVYFSAVWLGESLKLKILTTRVLKIAKRFFGIPSFHYYALADGIARLLVMLGRWLKKPTTSIPNNQPLQLCLKF